METRWRQGCVGESTVCFSLKLFLPVVCGCSLGRMTAVEAIGKGKEGGVGEKQVKSVEGVNRTTPRAGGGIGVKRVSIEL